MTDIADLAQQREGQFLAQSLAKQAQKNTAMVSNYYCKDCGEVIPQTRREVVQGCTRCVVCQEYAERGFNG